MVSTIKSGIINPDPIADVNVFIWLMTAAMLAGALWLNIATAAGAPASPPGDWASPTGARWDRSPPAGSFLRYWAG